MVDWAGHAGQSTERRSRGMAERQVRGISPSYERICLGVADDADLTALLDTLPAPKCQPNLLLAAVRLLAGPVESYPAFRSWVLGDSPVVLECRTSGPVPTPARLPDVIWRAGLGLNPLDVHDDEDVRRLQALIWPEQSASPHGDRLDWLRP